MNPFPHLSSLPGEFPLGLRASEGLLWPGFAFLNQPGIIDITHTPLTHLHRRLGIAQSYPEIPIAWI